MALKQRHRENEMATRDWNIVMISTVTATGKSEKVTENSICRTLLSYMYGCTWEFALSTQEARVVLGYRLGQLLCFFRA